MTKMTNLNHKSSSNNSVSITDTADTGHNEVTLELAKRESAEHIHGAAELNKVMRTRRLKIEAFPVVNNESIDSDISTATTPNIGIKTVHFIRHGQGFHNLMADLYSSQGRVWTQFTHSSDNPYIMPELYDAPLTHKGRQQARILQPRIQTLSDYDQEPQLVVISPLCRALQTGLIAFEHLIVQQTEYEQNHHQKKVPFIAHEMLREQSGVHVCDSRRPKSQQKLEFPVIDFDQCVPSEQDDLYQKDSRETKMQVGERIYSFMEWLASRKETNIGVVGHSGWLTTVFNGVVECRDESLQAWFQTGEMRTVRLVFSSREAENSH